MQTKPFLQIALALAAAFAGVCPALVMAMDGHAAGAEATATVKKSVASLKANGKDKAYAAIGDRHGRFIDRDMYLVVYDMDGAVYAHAANDGTIGKNLIDLKDIDGKPFGKERIELAQAKVGFWQDDKFADPTTKKIDPKRNYGERVGDAVLCGGIYK